MSLLQTSVDVAVLFLCLFFVPFQVFLLIQNEKIKNDYVYLSWLARCCKYRSKIYDGTLNQKYIELSHILFMLQH